MIVKISCNLLIISFFPRFIVTLFVLTLLLRSFHWTFCISNVNCGRLHFSFTSITNHRWFQIWIYPNREVISFELQILHNELLLLSIHFTLNFDFSELKFTFHHFFSRHFTFVKFGNANCMSSRQVYVSKQKKKRKTSHTVQTLHVSFFDILINFQINLWTIVILESSLPIEVE